MPNKANLAIYQGDDYSAVVTVLSDGAPADLTGYLAQAQIRSSYADASPTVVVEIETAVSGNQVSLAIAAAATVALTGPYLWDLQLVWPGGPTTTILAGAVTVTPEVTREA